MQEYECHTHNENVPMCQVHLSSCRELMQDRQSETDDDHKSLMDPEHASSGIPNVVVVCAVHMHRPNTRSTHNSSQNLYNESIIYTHCQFKVSSLREGPIPYYTITAADPKGKNLLNRVRQSTQKCLGKIGC